MTWGARAVAATVLVVLLLLALRPAGFDAPDASGASDLPGAPTAPAVTAAAPTVAPTPAPTSTLEMVVSRMARVVPTPVPRPTRPQAELGVAVVDFAFDPPELRVRVGQTVTWVNEGAEGHDVTGVGGQSWGSGSLAPRVSYRSTFFAAGRYDYVCTIHPEMRGRVVVAAS